MTARVFVDSNVLVYSRDASEPPKQKQALIWMTYLWKEKIGRLSFQVLNEFYVTVTQKLRPGLDPQRARADVRSLLAWNPLPGDVRIVEGAWLILDRYKLSWWDALIIAAAQASHCSYLLTEDLQEKQELGGIEVINPFRHAPDCLLSKSGKLTP